MKNISDIDPENLFEEVNKTLKEPLSEVMSKGDVIQEHPYDEDAVSAFDEHAQAIHEEIKQEEEQKFIRRGGARRELSPFAMAAVDSRNFNRALLQLTPFQQRFVEAYIKSPNAREAALSAGSKSKQPEVIGWQTLNNKNVQATVALGLKLRVLAASLDATEVVQKLRDIYYYAMEKEKYAEAISATKLMGEALGLFKPNGPGNINQKISVAAPFNKDPAGHLVDVTPTEIPTGEKDPDLKNLKDLLSTVAQRR